MLLAQDQLWCLLAGMQVLILRHPLPLPPMVHLVHIGSLSRGARAMHSVQHAASIRFGRSCLVLSNDTLVLHVELGLMAIRLGHA